CDEAFRRVGAKIQVDMPLSTVGTGRKDKDGKNLLKVAWEYSAGVGIWNPVPALTADLTSQPTIAFDRPADWQKVPIDGDSHFWLRARISAADYGPPTTYTISGTHVVPDDQPKPPIAQHLTVAYTISTSGLPPDHCLTYNGFQFTDVTEACLWG